MSKINKKLLLYLLVLALLLSFFLLRQTVFQSFRMKIVETTSLPVRIILFPFNEIKKIVTYRSTFKKYTQLKEEVETLRSRLIGQEEILRENNRFRELLDFKKSLVFSSVAANVIGRDPSNWNAAIIIDRGARDGLEAGMSVITALGVVGKIAEAGSSTSKVMLLSDPGFSVAALIQRTREGGLVTGTLTGACRMHYLPIEADIDIADKVITSKLSSSFPEGLLIGEVVEVRESQSSPTVECIVEPAVSLAQIEEVLVIKK